MRMFSPSGARDSFCSIAPICPVSQLSAITVVLATAHAPRLLRLRDTRLPIYIHVEPRTDVRIWSIPRIMNTALLAIPHNPMETVIIVIHRLATEDTGVISTMRRYNSVPSVGSRSRRHVLREIFESHTLVTHPLIACHISIQTKVVESEEFAQVPSTGP